MDNNAKVFDLKAQLGKRLEILGRAFDLVQFKIDRIESTMDAKEGKRVYSEESANRAFQQTDAFRELFYKLFRQTEDFADNLEKIPMTVTEVKRPTRNILGRNVSMTITGDQRIFLEIAMFSLDVLIEQFDSAIEYVDERNNLTIHSKIKLYEVLQEEKSKIVSLRADLDRYNNQREVLIEMQYMITPDEKTPSE